jgi:hypothetical protein
MGVPADSGGTLCAASEPLDPPDLAASRQDDVGGLRKAGADAAPTRRLDKIVPHARLDGMKRFLADHNTASPWVKLILGA